MGSLSRKLAVAAPALAAVAVYAVTLGAEFVYDDSAQILHNPWVVELRHFANAVTQPVWAFHTPVPTNYFRPFQMGTYNLLWAISGGSPFAFHLVNVLLHATAAAALARLVLGLGHGAAAAFGAGLLFAVHPLNTEAVSWIACLPELGYAAFGLIALLLHVAVWNAPASRRPWLRAGEVAIFALAVLAKETAVTLVPLVFLLELWVRPLVAPRPGPVAFRLRSLRDPLRACVPHAAVIALYTAFRLAAVGGVAPLARTGLTPWDAVLNAPWLLLSYLGKMIWPARLVAYHVFEPVTSLREPAFLLAAPVAVAVVVFLVLLSRRDGRLAFAGALMLVPLLPVLYIPAVGLNAFAERYAYLPTAGFAWLCAATLVAAGAKLARPWAARAAVATCVALSLPAAVHTATRARIWHDDARLAATTVAEEPRARTMWSLLAGTRKHGDPAAALRTLEEALRQFPNDPLLQADLVGQQLAMRAIAPAEAVRRLEAALTAGAVVYETYVYLGLAHVQNGDHAAAERTYRRAIELNPSGKVAYDGLALAILAQGRADVAHADLRERAGFSLGGGMDRLIDGAAHLTAGRTAEAERAFRDVLRDSPDSAVALLALAIAAAQRSDHAAAIDLSRRAIEARPDLADAYQQLAMSEMALGRHDAAIAALETAVGVSPHDKEIRNRLGVAYARAGKLEEARRSWLAALEIDPDHAGARFNLERLESGGR